LKIQRNKILPFKEFPQIDPNPEIPTKKAGVIVAFYNQAGKEGIILTKRTSHLRSHPGQISFPGGVYQLEDSSLLQTALREWEEEVGASKNDLEFLAPYKLFHTFTGYLIYPFLTEYKGNFQFRINPNEVEKIILLELNKFLTLPFYVAENPRRKGHQIYYFDLGEELLWGVTCGIIVSLLYEFTDFQKKPKLVQLNLSSPPFFNPKVL